MGRSLVALTLVLQLSLSTLAQQPAGVCGKELPVDLSNQPDLKRLGVSGALQLGTEMLPSEYVFQIVVTDLLAKEKRRIATQWIDFEIVK